MPVSLFSIPVSNSIGHRISLTLNGAIVASVDNNSSATITTQFNGVMIANPPHPPVMRAQNPAGYVGVHPGNLGYFEQAGGGGINLCYAQPGQAEQTVNFQ